MRITTPVKSLQADERGAISILSALALPSLIGIVGLAVEVGNGYAVHVDNQAIADTAALSAAEVYQATKTQSQWEAAARETVAAAGLPASSVTSTLVDSPDGSGAKAIEAVVTTQQPYFFSRIFNVGTSFSVGATSYARLPGDTPACIVALAQNATYGVDAIGGSALSAPDCSVVTNSNVYAAGGSSIASLSISAHGTISTPPYDSSITATSMKQGASIVSDPLAGNADIAAAVATLGTYTPVQTPAFAAIPSVSVSTNNPRFERTWWPVNTYAYKNGGTEIDATLDGDTWVFPAGTYNFDNLSTTEKIAFNGPTTINVNGSIAANWPSITIRGDGVVNVGGSIQGTAGLIITGAGTVNVGGDVAIGAGDGLIISGNAALNVGGSVTTTGSGFSLGLGKSATVNIAKALTVSNYFKMGDGNFAVGGRTTMQGSSTLSIGAGRHYFGPIDMAGATTLTVGDGDTDVNGKLTIGGASTAKFGNGAFAITKDSWGDGIAIQEGGGSSLTFGDGAFSVNGDISSAGNITFGETASHYINGNLTLSSNAVFGAGAYYINGDFTNTTTGSMTGTDVTFVLTGRMNLSGSATLTLTAPTSTGTGALKDMLLISLSTADTIIKAGGAGTLAGTIYVPNSNLTVNSGGTLSGGGQCWSLVAQTVDVQGGGHATTSACSVLSSGTNNSTTITLVR